MKKFFILFVSLFAMFCVSCSQLFDFSAKKSSIAFTLPASVFSSIDNKREDWSPEPMYRSTSFMNVVITDQDGNVVKEIKDYQLKVDELKGEGFDYSEPCLIDNIPCGENYSINIDIFTTYYNSGTFSFETYWSQSAYAYGVNLQSGNTTEVRMSLRQPSYFNAKVYYYIDDNPENIGTITMPLDDVKIFYDTSSPGDKNFKDCNYYIDLNYMPNSQTSYVLYNKKEVKNLQKIEVVFNKETLNKEPSISIDGYFNGIIFEKAINNFDLANDTITLDFITSTGGSGNNTCYVKTYDKSIEPNGYYSFLLENENGLHNISLYFYPLFDITYKNLFRDTINLTTKSTDNYFIYDTSNLLGSIVNNGDVVAFRINFNNAADCNKVKSVSNIFYGLLDSNNSSLIYDNSFKPLFSEGVTSLFLPIQSVENTNYFYINFQGNNLNLQEIDITVDYVVIPNNKYKFFNISNEPITVGKPNTQDREYICDYRYNFKVDGFELDCVETDNEIGISLCGDFCYLQFDNDGNIKIERVPSLMLYSELFYINENYQFVSLTSDTEDSIKQGEFYNNYIFYNYKINADYNSTPDYQLYTKCTDSSKYLFFVKEAILVSKE